MTKDMHTINGKLLEFQEDQKADGFQSDEEIIVNRFALDQSDIPHEEYPSGAEFRLHMETDTIEVWCPLCHGYICVLKRSVFITY